MEDEWPVVAEHFGQWIVEDKFVEGRPAWEDVGVMFVPDVKPYEYMKLRLLNGTHSALSYVSHLSGFQFVDDALNHGPINDFVVCYMDEVCHRCVSYWPRGDGWVHVCTYIYDPRTTDRSDGRPDGRSTDSGPTYQSTHDNPPTYSVPSVPGVDLEVYKKSLVTRFSNPYVKDKVERLMLDGSKKLPNTMRDAITHLTSHNLPTTHLALAVAAYTRYVTGIDLDGNELPEVLDPMADELREPARHACRLRSLPPTPTGAVLNGNGHALAAGAGGGAVEVEEGPVSDKVRGGCWLLVSCVGTRSQHTWEGTVPRPTSYTVHTTRSFIHLNTKQNPPTHTQEYDPREVLRLVFGAETAGNETFVGNVAKLLRMICEKGVPYALLRL